MGHDQEDALPVGLSPEAVALRGGSKLVPLKSQNNQLNAMIPKTCPHSQYGWCFDCVREIAMPKRRFEPPAERSEVFKELCRHISASPDLLSFLYDTDLLPEQLEFPSRDGNLMIMIAGMHKQGRLSFPIPQPTAVEQRGTPPLMRFEYHHSQKENPAGICCRTGFESSVAL
jgi:hypothetical protein